MLSFHHLFASTTHDPHGPLPPPQWHNVSIASDQEQELPQTENFGGTRSLSADPLPPPEALEADGTCSDQHCGLNALQKTVHRMGSEAPVVSPGRGSFGFTKRPADCL